MEGLKVNAVVVENLCVLCNERRRKNTFDVDWREKRVYVLKQI